MGRRSSNISRAAGTDGSKDIFAASEVTSLEACLQNDDIDVDDDGDVDFDLTGDSSRQ